MRQLPIWLGVLLLVPGCVDSPPPEEGELPGPEAADNETITQHATNLDTPWAIAPLPDGAAIVTERPGRVLHVDLDTGETATLAELDVAEVGESGLMGAAVHPEDPTRLFTCSSHRNAEGDLENRVTEHDLEDEALGESTVLVDGIAGARYHDGCRLRFGDAGRLYATMGDATEESTAQDPNTRNGKVLRMQPDGTPAGALDESDPYVFTMGHRNPQGVAIHPDTSRVWITEHGPETHDEVNRLVAGENYGWPDAMGEDTAGGSYQASAWTTGESGTIAPAGGAFVDAPKSPLHGDLVFANLKAAKLTVLDVEEDTVTAEEHVFERAFGRLRAIQFVDDALFVSTSNQDSRGEPGPVDDRIVRIPLDVLEDRVAD